MMPLKSFFLALSSIIPPKILIFDCRLLILSAFLHHIIPIVSKKRSQLYLNAKENLFRCNASSIKQHIQV